MATDWKSEYESVKAEREVMYIVLRDTLEALRRLASWPETSLLQRLSLSLIVKQAEVAFPSLRK